MNPAKHHKQDKAPLTSKNVKNVEVINDVFDEDDERSIHIKAGSKKIGSAVIGSQGEAEF